MSGTTVTRELFSLSTSTLGDVQQEQALRLQAGAIRSNIDTTSDPSNYVLVTEWNVLGQNDMAVPATSGGNFYAAVIQRDPRFRSTDAIRDMTLLEPMTRAAVLAIIADAKADQQIDLVVTETYRSTERQAQLFQEGRTQLQTVGVHHYGLAADFAKRIGTTLSWGGDWTFMIGLAGKHGLISGGDWGQPDRPHSFRDWDHVQRVTLDQQPQLFAGTWYPDAGAVPPAVVPAAASPAAATAAEAPPVIAPAALDPAAPAMSNLTPIQRQCLDIIDQLNGQDFAGWFLRSSVMATIQVESSFRPNAFRQEPSGVASYGLMQVLDTTAAGLGLVGGPEQLFTPKTAILYGMKYLKQGWDFLEHRFGRRPTLEEWCAGYNEGYGAAAQGRPDPAYVAVWMKAHDHWIAVDAN